MWPLGSHRLAQFSHARQERWLRQFPGKRDVLRRPAPRGRWHAGVHTPSSLASQLDAGPTSPAGPAAAGPANAVTANAVTAAAARDKLGVS